MARLNLKNLRKNVSENSSNAMSDIWSPMGNMNVGDVATVRFIPFIDEQTGGFWATQKLIPLVFTDNEDDSKEIRFNIPSLEMFVQNERCEIADRVREIFKERDAAKEVGDHEQEKLLNNVAMSHWMKYGYYLQGFVLSDNVDQNKVVPIRVTKSVYNMIHNSILGDESDFDELPTGSFNQEDCEIFMDGKLPDDLSEDEFNQLFVGRNFRFKKTEKGGYNNYDASTWEMKESTLTDEQINSIATNGLYDLSKLMPKKPTSEQYEVFAEMLEISIARAMGDDNGMWNPEWEEIIGFKPKRDTNDNTSRSETSKPKAKAAPKETTKETSNDDSDKEDAMSSMRSRLNRRRASA